MLSTGFFKTFKRSFSNEKISQLILAIESKNKDAIHAIVKNTPQIFTYQMPNTEDTALHILAKKGNTTALDFLLKQNLPGLDINRRCHCHLQRAPLHYAVEEGHFAMVELLLKIPDLNVHIKDEKNRNALEIALSKINESPHDERYDPIVVLLYEHGIRTQKMHLECNMVRERMTFMQTKFFEVTQGSRGFELFKNSLKKTEDNKEAFNSFKTNKKVS